MLASIVGTKDALVCGDSLWLSIVARARQFSKPARNEILDFTGLYGLSVIALCLLVWPGLSVNGCSDRNAGEQATKKEETVAMVKEAVAYYKANGREKALVAFSDQREQFRDRELF